MIYYDHLPLDKDILKALGELSINYVFQPIFLPDGKTVYAWEALMRPTEMTVIDLIDEYTKSEKLHVLEVATFFGAMQAFILRGYPQRVAINSFPCDCMSQEEADAFLEYFGEEIRELLRERVVDLVVFERVERFGKILLDRIFEVIRVVRFRLVREDPGGDRVGDRVRSFREL